MPNATQIEIAKRLGISQSQVSKVLTGFPGKSFPEAFRKKVFKAAREMGYDFGRTIRRRHGTRYEVRMPVEILVLDMRGRTHAKGKGVLWSVSKSGALVTQPKLSPPTFPAAPFRVQLTWSASGGGTFQVIGVPARFETEARRWGFGVSFEELSRPQLRELQHFLDAHESRRSARE